jgi:hypothetical protein
VAETCTGESWFYGETAKERLIIFIVDYENHPLRLWDIIQFDLPIPGNE